MNNADRLFLEERFNRIEVSLDEHGKQLARMEERWSIVCKFAGMIGGVVALITSIVIGMVRR